MWELFMHVNMFWKLGFKNWRGVWFWNSYFIKKKTTAANNFLFFSWKFEEWSPPPSKKNKVGVSHYGLAIYMKKYLKTKEELWKNKYFHHYIYIYI